jgi:hypothetical protein
MRKGIRMLATVALAVLGLAIPATMASAAQSSSTATATRSTTQGAASSALFQQQALDALAASNPNPPSPVNGSAAGAEASTTITPDAMSDCPSGDFCVWVNADWGGGAPAGIPAKFQGANATWAIFPQSGCPSGNWSNCASSGWNRRGLAIEVWQFANDTGASACLKAGWSLDDFAGYDWPGTSIPFNDSITSNEVLSSPSC